MWKKLSESKLAIVLGIFLVLLPNIHFFCNDLYEIFFEGSKELGSLISLSLITDVLFFIAIPILFFRRFIVHYLAGAIVLFGFTFGGRILWEYFSCNTQKYLVVGMVTIYIGLAIIAIPLLMSYMIRTYKSQVEDAK